MARVLIAKLSHETNQFSPIPTDLSSFEEGCPIRRGQPLITNSRGTRSDIGGFVEVLEREQVALTASIAASATPSGIVAAAAYHELKSAILDDIAAALRSAEGLDGILLALHGAMAAEGALDAEGDLLAAIRAVVPDRLPIVASMDLHGNITPAFCSLLQGVFAFDTNPHVDAYERALEAATWMVRILRGEVDPAVAIEKPPLMPPTIRMRTAEGPMAKLLARAFDLERETGTADVSIFGGFPYVDFAGAGMSIVVTADRRSATQSAAVTAREVADLAIGLRQEFLKPLTSITEAVELALLENGKEREPNATGQPVPPRRPLILADVSDNPGGGGSGDTTELLRALSAAGVRRTALAAFFDPAAVSQARSLGVGSSAAFTLGGRAPQYGEPLVLQCHVRALTDGAFGAYGPMGRGMTWQMGPSALLEIGGPDGLLLVVTSIRLAANDTGVLTSLGVLPEYQDVLVIKSRGHFRAAFEPLASRIVEVDAPGAAHPDLSRYTYHHIRRPMFPLDPLSD